MPTRSISMTDGRGGLMEKVVRAAILLALAAYIVGGIVIVPFHGDEPMQIHMSNDYVALLIDRDPAYLMAGPPYPIDSDAALRLINGSVNRYLIGFSWHSAGYTSGDLPPRPGWDWGLSYTENIATGHRPDDSFMTIARASSAVLTAVGMGLLYLVARAATGQPWAALVAAAVYALHPVVLVNGRRAMQEGSMLAFGLLAVAAGAAWVLLDDRAPAWRRIAVAALLALASALALASKHSAAVFVVGAYAIVGVDLLLRRAGWRRRITGSGLAAASGVAALALWVMLSPALWSDPVARVGDLLRERAALLNIQVVAHAQGVPMPLPQRVSALVTQPFLSPAQFFEVSWWDDDPVVPVEIDRYQASPLSGVHLGSGGVGTAIGGALTGLALLGIVASIWIGWRDRDTPRERLLRGAAVWTLLTAVSLLVNPLDWQRYYLVLIPPLIVMVAVAVGRIAHIRVRIRRVAPRS